MFEDITNWSKAMFRATLFALGLIALTNPALADEVSDTLSSAMQAYEDGDIDYAIEELEYAKQLLTAMKTGELEAFLPPAPEGYVRELDDSMNAGLSILGGGVGTAANYSGPEGDMSVTIMANNPMVAGLAGMIQNAGLLGMKLERIGREKFLWDSGQLSGLIDGRILVQIEADSKEAAMALAETMDFEGLKAFAN